MVPTAAVSECLEYDRISIYYIHTHTHTHKMCVCVCSSHKETRQEEQHQRLSWSWAVNPSHPLKKWPGGRTVNNPGDSDPRRYLRWDIYPTHPGGAPGGEAPGKSFTPTLPNTK